MSNPCVVVLHQEVTPSSSLDELDVLDQVAAVSHALATLGYEVATVPFSLNLPTVMRQLRKLRPVLVFNLVESVSGDGRLVALAPALLEHLRIPYSGCTSDAIHLTSHKPTAKNLMHGAGIPTPPWISLLEPPILPPPDGADCLVKAVWEHASVGLEPQTVRMENPVSLRELLRERQRLNRREFYAEEYIDGREFNLSVLGGEVLPIAEILFTDWEPDKLKIVDYQAKWIEDSFEYDHTCRIFEFEDEDKPLLEELHRLSKLCWDFFGLRGYARVDFRVDADNRPWVLEINANPCIGHHSGFTVAADEVGLDYTAMIERIIADTLRTMPDFKPPRRRSRRAAQASQPPA